MDNGMNDFLKKMSGNSDIITKNYYDSLVIETRLVDSALASADTDVAGVKLPTPVMLGVIGGFSHLGENALMKAAEAAKELDTVLWVSSHVNDEDLKALIATGAKIGFVCKPFMDQKRFIDTLKHAEELGVCLLASDIDHAYNKEGRYDTQGGNQFGPKSVAELREVVENVHLPFFAKGVLSVQDAVKCKEAGLAGVFLSHHHNMIASSIPPAMLAPEVRKAVGDDFCVIVDCGVNSGNEAFKALALGASAVCTARGYMAPLAKEGTEGVVNYVKAMTGQIVELLSRTGARDVRSIDPAVIHRMY